MTIEETATRLQAILDHKLVRPTDEVFLRSDTGLLIRISGIEVPGRDIPSATVEPQRQAMVFGRVVP